MNTKLPYAHTVPYFKTGRTAPDAWMQKTVDMLRKLGAKNVNEAFASVDGRSMFALSFEVSEDRFRVAWPVLPTKVATDSAAARIQAATFLYHECKARALSAHVLGVRSAFSSYLLLNNGQTVAEATNATIDQHMQGMPRLGHRS